MFEGLVFKVTFTVFKQNSCFYREKQEIKDVTSCAREEKSPKRCSAM